MGKREKFTFLVILVVVAVVVVVLLAPFSKNDLEVNFNCDF
jgi:hypothetical protein